MAELQIKLMYEEAINRINDAAILSKNINEQQGVTKGVFPLVRQFCMSSKIVHLLFSRPRRLQKILGFTAVPLLLAWSVAGAANAPVRATPKETDQKRTERRKIFLLRSADEVNWSLIFANEAIDVLTGQIKAAAGHEPEIEVDERAALLKWYHHYAAWLSGISDHIQSDIGDYFSGKQIASWVRRSQELERGSGKMAGELSGTVRRLERERSRIIARMQKLKTVVAERRLLINKNNLELARELWPGAYRKSYRNRKAVCRILTDGKIVYLQDNLRLLEDRQKYYDVLIELGKYEYDWLHIKARDFSKLTTIARAMTRNDSAGTIRASRGAVRTYKADIAALKKRAAELDAKLDGMTKADSIKTFERLEELSRYYEMMKSRYERQIECLTGQIESYQADFHATKRSSKAVRQNLDVQEKRQPGQDSSADP